jgi:heat shock protein HslJ
MRWSALLVILAATACAPAPGAGQARETVVDREWRLAALGDRSDPQGAGGRPPTLTLDSKAGRAAGFAGCNRFSAAYQLEGDALAFGPILSTKMACERGMELEAAYLEALAAVASYTAADGELTLRAADGALLRFRVAPAEPAP